MEVSLRTILMAALIATTALPVFAAERCTAPKDKWRPVDELKAELSAKNWSIKKVKIEDGCYEVYGKDDKGQRVEIFFDPVTFAAVGSDD
jgi:hypothetical protein